MSGAAVERAHEMTPQCSNVIGRQVSRERYQRGWTQAELVVKLQLLGCYMTRDILASIETRRCVTTDKQIEFFAEVFGIQVHQLFPAARHFVGRAPEFHEPKHRRRPQAKTRLAHRPKK
jgi:ribosome-binding protein aMBF1 (putative translation factor)